jgi:GNAT superfamily N-acetyltransferase
LLEFPRPAEILESRYEQGSACFAAYRAGDFAGFIWLAPGTYLEDEVRCTFVPGPAGSACWDYDVYVTPGERTGIAFMKLWSAALEHLRQRGVEWSASRISAFAPASLAAHKRMGAVCVGQAFFLVAFGLQAMVASVPPYLHLSASRRSHPTLRVEAPRRK